MKMRLASTLTISSLFHVGRIFASNNGSPQTTGLRQRKILFDDSPTVSVSGGMRTVSSGKGNSDKKGITDDSTTVGKKNTGKKGNGKKDGDNGSKSGDNGNKGKGGDNNPKSGESLAPYLTLSETEFYSGDALIVDFRVLVDESSNFNITNIGNWSVGIYMRMAHPQDGALAPITSLKPTLIDDDGSGYRLGSAFFNSANVPLMEGRDPSWPTDPVEYGSGYDAWLLTEDGVGILGPETFIVLETPAMSNAVTEDSKIKPDHGLVKYNHAATKKNSYGNSSKDNDKEGDKGNGKGGGKGSDKSDMMIIGTTPALSQADYSIVTDKTEYAIGDSVSVSYTLNVDAPDIGNITDWTVGIYMRMAHPQDGALEPIVSIPLCGLSDCEKKQKTDFKVGMVSFKEGTSGMEGDWPIDFGDYGYGFDAWLLDEYGSGKAGPHGFGFTVPVETSL